MCGAPSPEFQLLAPTADDAQVIRLVTTHAGLLDALEIVDNTKELELITRDGNALRGSNTICKHIAAVSAAGQSLLGGDADGKALVWLHINKFLLVKLQHGFYGDPPPLQVAQWLSTRYSMLSPVNEEGLQKLDDALLTRTFLVGTTLSLADLVLFGVLHRAVVGCLGWH